MPPLLPVSRARSPPAAAHHPPQGLHQGLCLAPHPSLPPLLRPSCCTATRTCRCARCNGEFQAQPRPAALLPLGHDVPAGIQAQHEEFWVCSRCRWGGGCRHSLVCLQLPAGSLHHVVQALTAAVQGSFAAASSALAAVQENPCCLPPGLCRTAPHAAACFGRATSTPVPLGR